MIWENSALLYTKQWNFEVIQFSSEKGKRGKIIVFDR